MSNSSLPEDMVFDILSRLPVKSLLRFKSVCRSWRSMITGRRFVSEHLRRSSMDGSVHHVVITKHASRIGLLSSILEVQSEVETPTRIGSYDLGFAIARSCNGIVCLICVNGPALIWNPATGEFRTVPNSVGSSWYFNNQYGFGYISKTDDYKLVRIEKSRGPGPLLAEVFTFREGSWRKVQPPDYYPDCHIAGTFVNGTVNWIDRGVESRPILSFDLDKDEFKSISLPPGSEGGHSRRKLAALESALLFIAYSWETRDGGFDLWMTNPQAPHPIWTRLPTVYPLVRHPWPLGVGKRGEIYITEFVSGVRTFAYEPSTGKRNALCRIPGTPSQAILHPHVESLVPFPGE